MTNSNDAYIWFLLSVIALALVFGSVKLGQRKPQTSEWLIGVMNVAALPFAATGFAISMNSHRIISPAISFALAVWGIANILSVIRPRR